MRSAQTAPRHGGELKPASLVAVIDKRSSRRLKPSGIVVSGRLRVTRRQINCRGNRQRAASA
jgi:hypothetical protein